MTKPQKPRFTPKQLEALRIEMDETLPFVDYERARRRRLPKRLGSLHDIFFHYFMRKKWFAIDFLTAFSGEWGKDLDFSRLKIVASDHYDFMLRKRVADLVYEVPYKDSDKTTTISIIVEHKAQGEQNDAKKTLVNLMSYVVEQTAQQAEESEGQETPQAIALLVYTGKDPNYKSPTWKDLFPLPANLRRFAIHQEIPCINLTKLYLTGKLKKITGVPVLRLMTEIMAIAGLRLLRQKRKVLFDAISNLKEFNDELREILEACARYILGAARNYGENFTEEESDDLYADIVNEEVREEMETLFEKAERKGRKEGIIEGKIEGKIEVLQQWVNAKYPNCSSMINEQIENLPDKQLPTLIEMLSKTLPIEEFIQGVKRLVTPSLTKTRLRSVGV